MQIRTSSGKHFEAAPSDSLLEAAQRAKVTFPYSCKTGRCSTCKGRVKSGRTVAMHEEIGLSDDERAAGWILTCIRSADTDVELEIEDLGENPPPPVRTLACRIHALERLAPDVIKATLRFPPTADFSFFPGQYVDVIGHGGLRRSYSIANAPSPNKMIELHIRQVPGGAMSDYWFERAQPNDLLRINGPLGTFFLRNTENRHLIFLATGTGIAPVNAMLQSLAALDGSGVAPSSVTVYWGGRYRRDLYCDLSTPSVPFRFVPVLSQVPDEDCAHGHVQDIALSQPLDLANTTVFACGSDAMIHGAHAAFLAAGLEPRRFHSDAFVCSAAA